MTQLTLEIADELEAALVNISRKLHKPETEVALELLEQVLLHQSKAGSAQNWLSTWRGSVQKESLYDPSDARISYLLDTHLS